MADVTFVEGGARNSNVPTLFQVVDGDSGVMRWVNADLTTHIVPSFRCQDTKYKVMLTRACPHQEHTRHQGCLRKELGDHRANPEKH